MSEIQFRDLDKKIAWLRPRLLRWYGANKRELPWRLTKDPYAIWVSEIMLQQTRVDTVIPYYKKFMRRFPTLRSLADASEDDVLAMWSGLGYYRRARLLHQGVREVAASYGGAVPECAEERLGLSGIGRYTAGAIGSFAFDNAEPIVDGNVSRFLARVFEIDTPLGRSDTTKRLWELASKLVIGDSPSDFNQSFMEIGALVCTVKPICESCPVCERCAAYSNGRTESLPVTMPKKKALVVNLTAVVVRKKQRVLLLRSKSSLYTGLWQPPQVEGKGIEKARQALAALKVDAALDNSSKGFVHVLSHRKIHVHVWSAEVKKNCSIGPTTGRFFAQKELEEVGVSKLVRRILEASGVSA